VFQNESHDEIDNYGTSKSEKRQINKVHADGSTADAELFAPPGANAVSLLFKPGDNSVNHNTNIEKQSSF
jgi:hypothetical protein